MPLSKPVFRFILYPIGARKSLRNGGVILNEMIKALRSDNPGC
jgi:hypothetical protein